MSTDIDKITATGSSVVSMTAPQTAQIFLELPGVVQVGSVRSSRVVSCWHSTPPRYQSSIPPQASASPLTSMPTVTSVVLDRVNSTEGFCQSPGRLGLYPGRPRPDQPGGQGRRPGCCGGAGKSRVHPPQPDYRQSREVRCQRVYHSGVPRFARTAA